MQHFPGSMFRLRLLLKEVNKGRFWRKINRLPKKERFTYKKNEDMKKEEKRNKQLLDILEKDFEELSAGELQVLRNETRKLYGIEGKIEVSMILNSYLNMKRKYINELEQVLVTVKQTVRDFGVFGGGKQVVSPRIQVPTFDGLNGASKGMFYIDGYTYLPVLTVSYFDDHTEVICLSPEGSFCRISTKDFDFEI